MVIHGTSTPLSSLCGFEFEIEENEKVEIQYIVSCEKGEREMAKEQ